MRGGVYRDAACSLEQHDRAAGVAQRRQDRPRLAIGQAGPAPQHLLQARHARISGMRGEPLAVAFGERGKQAVLRETGVTDIVGIEPPQCETVGRIVVGQQHGFKQLVQATGRPGPAVVGKAARDRPRLLHSGALRCLRLCSASQATFAYPRSRAGSRP